jgi:hypothetical protein
MYSVYGDTVLDPFWGTGTTSLAALVAGRNSVGYELEADFTQVFDERVRDAPDISRNVIQRRLDDHREFVEKKHEAGDDFEYDSENYDFPVITKQEKPVQFYAVGSIDSDGDVYRATHYPVEGE